MDDFILLVCTAEAVCMLFDVPKYKKFKVDSDDDIQNILCLGKSFKLNHVDVLIQARNVRARGNVGVVDCVEDGVNSPGSPNFGVDDQTDLLPTYWPNKSKTFLSAQWVYVITHVGQCFDGGANEFREVLCNVHTCGAVVWTYRNLHTRSELVSSVVSDRVRGQPLIRPTDVVFDLKNGYGLDISYRVEWLGVEKTGGEVYGDHAMSFHQLRWVQSLSAFVFPGQNIPQRQNFPMYKWDVMKLTTNRNNMKEVVGDVQTLMFISDHHIGLLQSMPNIFPSIHHGYCLFHLQMNFQDRMKYVNASHKIGLMHKLRECAYAPTVSCFNEKFEVLKRCSLVVIKDFIKDLHSKHWANEYFRGQRYGEMCSNAAESFNNWISDACHLPITRLVDMVKEQIMEQMAEYGVKCKKWAGVICWKLEKKKKLAKTYNENRSWCVSQANDNVYEVHSHPSVLVDVGRKNIHESIDCAFHIDTFKASYNRTIYPIPTVDKPPFTPADYMITPSTVKRPQGNPQLAQESHQSDPSDHLSLQLLASRNWYGGRPPIVSVVQFNVKLVPYSMKLPFDKHVQTTSTVCAKHGSTTSCLKQLMPLPLLEPRCNARLGPRVSIAWNCNVYIHRFLHLKP
ncbi:hypothetical protein ACSBR1_007336 [Camellia fascicularis]